MRVLCVCVCVCMCMCMCMCVCVCVSAPRLLIPNGDVVRYAPEAIA